MLGRRRALPRPPKTTPLPPPCASNPAPPGSTPIAPEDLGRLFEPYWRPAGQDAAAGLGLGLYICHEIVKAHGGTLRAQSDLEVGTRFEASLPVR
ncbi:MULTISPECIES: sensor histidine kinase KdpD [unclassified Cupriavidus]|nr:MULTISPECIES: sensor histidine kinase [unclassified Cupriavidus]